MSEKQELKSRVEAKKHEIQARIEKMKADSNESEREKISMLQDKLNQLGDTLQGGWDDMNESISARLNDWLKDDSESEK